MYFCGNLIFSYHFRLVLQLTMPLLRIVSQHMHFLLNEAMGHGDSDRPVRILTPSPSAVLWIILSPCHRAGTPVAKEWCYEAPEYIATVP